ncbi:MAG: class IV adenylate cyclase [Candidatus Njordarchaeia archaeon]
MLEVEYKARIESIKTVYDYLIGLGFEYSKINFKDTYYEHPCKSFKESDEELRLRVNIENDQYKIYLTYKGPSLTADRSARLEIETQLQGDKRAVAEIDSILKALGFIPKIWKFKKGYLLRNKEFEITLAEVSGGKGEKIVSLGYFIEIEKKIKDESEKREAEREIREFMKKIPGIKSIETRYYTEMIEESINDIET